MLALAFAIALTVTSAAPAKGKPKAKTPAASKAAPAPAAPAPAPAADPAPAPAPAAAEATPPVAPVAPVTLPPPTPAKKAEAPPPVAPAPKAQPGQPRMGVVDFSSSPELQPLASALAGVVANELQRLGAFQVTTTDQIRQMLSLERQAQLLGCPDDSCRGDVVVSLGFDYVVTGKVTRLARDKGASTVLELVIIDQKKGERLSSDVVQGATEAELMTRITPSVIKLVNAPLKARSGTLVIASSEAGATVKIDDVVVGTTPIGSTTVAGGPHFVSVEKNGFVSWQKEVRVQPDQLVEEDVRMVPSPDFINAYKSKQTALRGAMYGATVLAIAGIGTGIVMGFLAQVKYGSETTPGTFLYERKQILDGNEMDMDGDHRAMANALKAQVETYRMLGYLGVGVGAAFGITAAVLRLMSDDPGKYDLYRSADVKVSLSPLLSPFGGGAALSGAF